MAMRVGGQSPDSYGLSLSVKVPLATAVAPVTTNQPLKWGATAYEAVAAVDGDVFTLVAKHPVEDALTPLGVWLVNEKTRVHVFTYTGTAPTIGSGVVANGTGGVKAAIGTEPDLNNQVLYVDTVRLYVEVLI